MPIQLNYQGGSDEVLNEAAAFSARRKVGGEGTVLASGDFLYRIFPTPQRVFFIKLDSGTDTTTAFIFGRIGHALQRHFTRDKRKAQVQAMVANFQGQRPAHLLSQDKANHVIPRGQITQPTIEPPSWWTGAKFGRFWFRDAKKRKRVFHFEDTESFLAAVNALRNAFGSALIVRAEYDPTRNKIVKTKG